MFELEDYSSGFHEGYLNKYAESSGPTLDFYITDSLQDMLDMDIRSEIATVVGGSNELASLVSDLPSSFDHAIDAISAINNSASSSNSCSSNNSYLHSSAWLSATSGPTWSSSNDFYADVGACVNPISVMPMISSSLMHRSPKTNLNVNGLSSATSPPPPSPTENKSHLTFSPAHIKQSTNAMRNEQFVATSTTSSSSSSSSQSSSSATSISTSTVTAAPTLSSSSIPKQIVAISSAVTSATTAPATMATNSALQRKSSAIDAIKKDLSAEISKAGSNQTTTGSIIQSNGLISATNTIKLAPGIGGLTFANSITYNKLKQQSTVKSPNGTPLTSNGTIVLKRDRDSSPLHHMTTLNLPNGTGGNAGSITNGFHNGQHVTKILSRNVVQTSSGFTPKSIASAQSPLIQNASNGSGGNFSIGSPSSSSNSSSNFGAGRLTPLGPNGRLTPINGTGRVTPITTNATTGRLTPIPVKTMPPKPNQSPHDREFPKPAYSYSCLIAMALKNSRSGSLPVSEIYSFMCEHFPYFKTAPSGWKNSVRHNLSLNKCFEKIEKPATNGNQRKGCLWAMNPERITKMDEEVQKWSRKDPMAIRKAMVFPEHLEALERGEMKHGSTSDSDLELDSQSEIEETSDSEQDHELVDDTIVESMFVEEDIEEIEDDMGMIGGGSSSSQHHMLVVNENDVSNEEDVCDVGLAQQHRDFDIEVEDIYDAIDMEDDKEAVRMALSQSDIIEMGTADIINAQNVTASNTNIIAANNISNSTSNNSGGYQSPKRARLNVNYSIRPAAAENIEKVVQVQQTTTKTIPVQTTYKQIKVHPTQPQHILVQTLTKRANSPHGVVIQQHQQQQQQHPQLHTQYKHFTAIPNHNRRKMQLVNRIA